MSQSREKYLEYLLTNDRKGIQSIYNTFLPKIEAIIRGMGGNKDEAWEIFQESLIVILKRAEEPKFTLSSSFYTYLVSVCKYKWFNESKKKYKKNVTLDSIGTLKDTQDIEQTVQELERYKLYKDKLSQLSPECQELLEHFFRKVPLREIANKMGLKTENAAKQKKYKCQKALITKIKKDIKYDQLV